MMASVGIGEYESRRVDLDAVLLDEFRANTPPKGFSGLMRQLAQIAGLHHEVAMLKGQPEPVPFTYWYEKNGKRNHPVKLTVRLVGGTYAISATEESQQ